MTHSALLAPVLAPVFVWFSALAAQTTVAPQLVPPAEKPDVKPAAPAQFTPPAGDATPQKPLYAPKSYDAKFAKAAPKLDGKLDDAAWALDRKSVV